MNNSQYSNNTSFGSRLPVRILPQSAQYNYGVNRNYGYYSNDYAGKQIEQGDKKSMDALKWIGLIGAGTLAAGASAYCVAKGKDIDLKEFVHKKADDFKEKFQKGFGDIKGSLKSKKNSGENITEKFDDNGNLINKSILDKDGNILKNELFKRNKNGDIIGSFCQTTKNNITTHTYALGDDKYVCKYVRKDGNVVCAKYTYGKNTIIENIKYSKDGTAKKTSRILNGKKIKDNNTKLHELIGLDEQKYQEFLTIQFPI